MLAGRGAKAMESTARAVANADSQASTSSRNGDMMKADKTPLVAPLYANAATSAKGRTQASIGAAASGSFRDPSEVNGAKHVEQHLWAHRKSSQPSQKMKHHGHHFQQEDGHQMKQHRAHHFQQEDDGRVVGNASSAAVATMAATATANEAENDYHEVREIREVREVREVREAAFASPNIVRDPPLGEGWDSCGNDLSKVANDAIRKAQCESWVAKLRQEASAIRAGDHPEVVRRSVMTVEASKRRIQSCEKHARQQQTLVKQLYELEAESIHASYENTMEQARERLMGEINEKIRRSKSRLDGVREVENRMNTRHTRGNTKGAMEDPFLQTPGSKTNGNSKRPLCPVSLVLEEDDMAVDIEFIRYSGHHRQERNNGRGGRGGGSGVGGFDAFDMSPGVSGRARRPPVWRRDN